MSRTPRHHATRKNDSRKHTACCRPASLVINFNLGQKRLPHVSTIQLFIINNNNIWNKRTVFKYVLVNIIETRKPITLSIFAKAKKQNARNRIYLAKSYRRYPRGVHVHHYCGFISVDRISFALERRKRHRVCTSHVLYNRQVVGAILCHTLAVVTTYTCYNIFHAA
jgi:hypothetical protein